MLGATPIRGTASRIAGLVTCLAACLLLHAAAVMAGTYDGCHQISFGLSETYVNKPEKPQVRPGLHKIHDAWQGLIHQMNISDLYARNLTIVYRPSYRYRYMHESIFNYKARVDEQKTGDTAKLYSIDIDIVNASLVFVINVGMPEFQLQLVKNEYHKIFMVGNATSRFLSSLSLATLNKSRHFTTAGYRFLVNESGDPAQIEGIWSLIASVINAITCTFHNIYPTATGHHIWRDSQDHVPTESGDWAQTMRTLRVTILEYLHRNITNTSARDSDLSNVNKIPGQCSPAERVTAFQSDAVEICNTYYFQERVLCWRSLRVDALASLFARLEGMTLLSRLKIHVWMDAVNKLKWTIHRRVVFNQLTRGKAKKMSILKFKHLGGICLANLLSSYPGPRPWSRVGHS